MAFAMQDTQTLANTTINQLAPLLSLAFGSVPISYSNVIVDTYNSGLANDNPLIALIEGITSFKSTFCRRFDRTSSGWKL
jgi:hypothetical protein